MEFMRPPSSAIFLWLIFKGRGEEHDPLSPPPIRYWNGKDQWKHKRRRYVWTDLNMASVVTDRMGIELVFMFANSLKQTHSMTKPLGSFTLNKQHRFHISVRQLASLHCSGHGLFDSSDFGLFEKSLSSRKYFFDECGCVRSVWIRPFLSVLLSRVANIKQYWYLTTV